MAEVGKREPMRVGEVAQALGVHPETVRLWTKRGRLVPLAVTPFGSIYAPEVVEQERRARQLVGLLDR